MKPPFCLSSLSLFLFLVAVFENHRFLSPVDHSLSAFHMIVNVECSGVGLCACKCRRHLPDQNRAPRRLPSSPPFTIFLPCPCLIYLAPPCKVSKVSSPPIAHCPTQFLLPLVRSKAPPPKRASSSRSVPSPIPGRDRGCSPPCYLFNRYTSLKYLPSHHPVSYHQVLARSSSS